MIGARPYVVAFVSAEEMIHVFDVETGEAHSVFSGRLIFAGTLPSYKHPLVITASGDEDILFINIDTGENWKLIKGGFDKVFRAVISQDIHHPALVFTTWNAQNRRSTIQTYDLSDECSSVVKEISNDSLETQTADARYHSSKFSLVFEGDSRDGVTCVVVSAQNADRPIFCSGHYDSMVRVWDLATKQLLLVLEGHMDWVVSVALWKSVEPIVVSGSSDGTIRVWDLDSGDLVTSCEGHQRDVWSVTVTQGPRPLIVSASSDRTVRTWDINRINYFLDSRWERRKAFCMFLWCSKILDRESKGIPRIHPLNTEYFSSPRHASAETIPSTDTFPLAGLLCAVDDESLGVSLEAQINRARCTSFADSKLGKHDFQSNDDSRAAFQVFMSLFLCEIIASFI